MYLLLRLTTMREGTRTTGVRTDTHTRTHVRSHPRAHRHAPHAHVHTRPCVPTTHTGSRRLFTFVLTLGERGRSGGDINYMYGVWHTLGQLRDSRNLAMSTQQLDQIIKRSHKPKRKRKTNQAAKQKQKQKKGERGGEEEKYFELLNFLTTHKHLLF